MTPVGIDHPLLGFDKGIPVCIGFAHVLEDTLVVPDVDTDGYELGMAVDADAVGFEDFDFDTLIALRLNEDLGSRIGNIYRNDKRTDIETGTPF